MTPDCIENNRVNFSQSLIRDSEKQQSLGGRIKGGGILARNKVASNLIDKCSEQLSPKKSVALKKGKIDLPKPNQIYPKSLVIRTAKPIDSEPINDREKTWYNINTRKMPYEHFALKKDSINVKNQSILIDYSASREIRSQSHLLPVVSENHSVVLGPVNTRDGELGTSTSMPEKSELKCLNQPKISSLLKPNLMDKVTTMSQPIKKIKDSTIMSKPAKSSSSPPP